MVMPSSEDSQSLVGKALLQIVAERRLADQGKVKRIEQGIHEFTPGTSWKVGI